MTISSPYTAFRPIAWVQISNFPVLVTAISTGLWRKQTHHRAWLFIKWKCSCFRRILNSKLGVVPISSDVCQILLWQIIICDIITLIVNAIFWPSSPLSLTYCPQSPGLQTSVFLKEQYHQLVLQHVRPRPLKCSIVCKFFPHINILISQKRIDQFQENRTVSAMPWFFY